MKPNSYSWKAKGCATVSLDVDVQQVWIGRNLVADGIWEITNLRDILDECIRLVAPDEDQQADSEWIPHDGRGFPKGLDPNAMTRVIFADGDESEAGPADEWEWKWDNTEGDIVAYKVVKEK